MLTPWSRAAGYAALVTLPSWLWGAIMASVLLSFGDLSSFTFDPDTILGGGLLFPPVAFVALTVVRKTLPALSRWRTATIDTSVYATLVLVTTVLSGWWVGDVMSEAVDWAFVTMTIALFDLQFVVALGLSAWGYDRLVPTAPSGRTGGGRARAI
ncbi:hypothetical protein [Streptomyces capitiformicae]|uniref:Uncharacterized protein n=1 Tax=Streptomyces capitiformicae TaxID=2014920 RepID=A0A919GCS4_9ACTN|nr:hypothetical protein [Streptomyces capitiformicae]GHH82115.1 hypothetical protein GCM10017771_05410 [Streptomyces capitiformicae]